MFPVTAVFVGLFVCLQVPITVMVGLRRLTARIPFLDGGDRVLLRRIRAHGNFTETVPITLLAMAAAEATAAPPWLLLAAGIVLLAGRLVHLRTLLVSEFGTGRAVGMVMTFLPMLVLGLWSIVTALPGVLETLGA